MADITGEEGKKLAALHWLRAFDPRFVFTPGVERARIDKLKADLMNAFTV